MSSKSFKESDFDHPSTLFIFEDKLKGPLGGTLFYNSYFKAFKLKGNERVLDFDCGGGAGSLCLAYLLDEGGHLTCVDKSQY